MTSFIGHVPASKSILNRALILQSFEPDLRIYGVSDSDDVVKMKAGIKALEDQAMIDCGEGGTVLRFLALRASREKGRHKLTGSARLINRPQEELVKILSQLGVTAKFEKIRSPSNPTDGAQGDTLHVPSHRSSQFASAVLLNAWELPFDLHVSPVGAGVSEGYWRMTQKLVTDAGMKLDRWDQDFRIPARQKISATSLTVEPDMSSAFALAAAAGVGGSTTLLDFPVESLQPDSIFPNILQKMGVPIQFDCGRLKVQRAQFLRGVAVRLTNAPDLFPVLATLCALAEGDSELYGAPQLVHKESDRIARTAELLRVTGRTLTPLEDGLRVGGVLQKTRERSVFNPDRDHRLAMAAGVLKLAGIPIHIENPEVVNKSFAGFWQSAGIDPS
jgi:3-phosphoshikimate 1-carboxyvinyltransferase